MDNMDEIRLRLARADEAGKKAWSEATGLARRVINTCGSGVADDEALRMLAERLGQVRIALNELGDVTELLSRSVTGNRRRSVAPLAEDAPCVVCQRVDALVKVPICARCSGLGPFVAVRWSG